MEAKVMPTIRSQAITKEGSNANNIVATPPSGIVDGDLLLAFLVKDNDEAYDTIPSGWVEVETASGDNASNSCRFTVWRKAASGESGNYTFGYTGTTEEHMAVILRIDEHDPAAPINASNVGTGDSTAPISPTITTNVDGCLIIACAGMDDDDTPFALDGALSPEWNDVSSTGSGTCGSMGGSETQASLGPTGTYTHSIFAADEWVGITLAIAPASGGLSIPVAMNNYRQHNQSVV